MKKFLALLLTVIMLASVLSACSPAEVPEAPKESSSIEESSTPEETPVEEPEETSRYNASTNIPTDLNYGDKEVHFVSREFSIYNDELTVENTTGDPIIDAVYQRNINVETQLGITIVNNKMSPGADFYANFDIINKVKNEMEGNAFNYDIMLSPSFACVFRTSDGLWEDLNTVSYLDLDKEYWSSNYNEQVTIGNRQYFATGPISLSLQRMVYATMFNKTLAEQHNLEDLYQVVREGRWTMDYQSQILANSFNELDGVDGHTAGDFYGFVSNTNLSTDPYWTIWDVDIFSRTEDNYLTYDFDTESATNFITKVIDFYWGNDSVYLYLPVGEGDEQADIRKHFTDGRAIMAHLKLQEVETEEMRAMEDPYGILPLPKYEENDKPYYSSAFHSFTCVSILKGQSLDESDMCGAVLEAMACESYNVVQPAYYEVALKGKYSKDPQSWEMLDDMMKNFRVDQDFLYSSTDDVDLLQQFRSAVYNQNRGFGAGLALQQKRLKITLNQLIDNIRVMHGD